MSLEISDYILENNQSQQENIQENNIPEPIQQQDSSAVVEDKAVEQTPSPQSDGVDIKSKIKEIIGIELDDVSKLKEFYEGYNKLNDLKKELEEYKKFKEEYDNLVNNFKVDKIFANESVLALNEIMKKYPNIPPHIASKIVSTDLDKIDKLQAIVLAERLENPDLDISDNAIINALFPDLPEDPSEWSETDKYKINKYAKEAIKKLNEIKQYQKPEIDIENIIKQQTKNKEEYINNLKNTNSKVIKQVLDEYYQSGLKLKLKGINNEDVVYEFKLDKDDVDNYFNELLNDTIETNFLVDSEDAVKRIKDVVEEDFKIRYFNKIVNDYAQKLLSEYKEKMMRELHNPSALQSTPVNSTEQDYSEEIIKSILGL